MTSELLGPKELVTVFTGAGVSTDSGIPDYRGPNGVWTRDPAARRLSTRADYLADPQLRRTAWRNRAAHPVWSARPNVTHRAIAALQETGRVTALVTQNIDGLHQQAGSTGVLELHGTLREAVCVGCEVRRPMPEVLDRVRAGEEDPPCPLCGGVLTSATVAFGQPLEADTWAAATRAVASCDVMLALGSSLTVHPAAGLCGIAVRAGARLVVVNAQPTPYDSVASAVVREPVGDVVPELVRRVA